MSPAAASGLDVKRLREDFPILHTRARGKPLVYLDNAATTQKPRAVIDALVQYYEHDNANVHRGVHELSERATLAYEAARGKLRRLLNAREDREIVFVRGTTEAINLVAQSFGRSRVGPGDEVLVTGMEHHSNIVPWQLLCQERGARLRVLPIDDRGELALDELEELLGRRTRLLAVAHVSNALGTVNPLREIVAAAHARGVPVLVDGAQAVAHGPVDVQALGCDFYALSGHKLYGPMGIGALWARAELLEEMPPWQGGGDMIASVSFEKTTYNVVPYKFEAGTPNVAGAIGLGAAVDYLEAVGLERAAAWEAELLRHAVEALEELPQVRLVGTPRERAAVISFLVEGVHAHDVGTILDQEGIAIRTGHHCAQPVMDRFGIPATARASFALYNTHEEVDALVRALHRVIEVFG
jgi:cysteine desulfurase/selenocysteine lyase